MDAQRSSSTKKSMTELTDSGVSVVSDVPPPAIKDNRLLNWLKETDGSPSSGAQGGGSGAMKSGDINAAVAKATRKKFQNLPQQPFVGDPGMPLLPQPHTVSCFLLHMFKEFKEFFTNKTNVMIFLHYRRRNWRKPRGVWSTSRVAAVSATRA